ncbi:MAG: FitA-like ribbon-helix-helix domain-containing protein [Haloferula sp.]
MAQLIVRKLEDELVQKLRSRAARHGVSAEEEHRRILRSELNRPLETKPSLLGFLLSEEVAADVDLPLERSVDPEDRPVDL